jgi:[ribosomal protein S5]-alanine N-acetyltransferase
MPSILFKKLILIGHIAFFKYFGEHTFEIGWVFNPKYCNKGYASEAAYALLKYGFEELKLHRIIATCQPENTGSYRVMEKIGMRREGYFKSASPTEMSGGMSIITPFWMKSGPIMVDSLKKRTVLVF